MFGFFKKRREIHDAQRKIGVDLHRQIRDALQTDDRLASENLSSAFTVGYIFTFVRDAFIALDVDAASDINNQIRYICDGVLPKKLYAIYTNQAAAIELAEGMKEQDKYILNTGLKPSDVRKTFALGVKAAAHDAPLVGVLPQAENLKRYLLNEPLQIF